MKKTLWNPSFLICVFIVTALCFTTAIYTDTNTGQEYTVLDCLTKLSRNQLLADEKFASYNVVMSSIGGYLAMFLPILAAFPFIPNFCSERNSGLIRLTIYRTGKFRYYFSKFISALFGGGLAIMLGYIIYTAMAFALFPSINDYSVKDGMEMMNDYAGWKTVMAKQLIGSFVYGAVATVPAFIFSSFIKNRYVITCLPFMLSYMYTTAITKITMNLYNESFAASDAQNFELSAEKFKLASKISNFSPKAVINILTAQDKNEIILLNASIVVVGFIIFVVVMNLRLDKGE